MKRRSRETTTPDLTPLIDVVFLLLIFFMVSTVFKKEELALLLNLPSSETSEKTAKQMKSITIEINKDELAFNGKKIDQEELSLPVSKIQDKKTPVFLRVDEAVEYKKVVKVLDILKKFKMTNLTLVTEKD